VRVTIDNLDGAGARDYSAALSADGPLKVERVLHAASRCSGLLDVAPFGLPVPVRGARVVVMNDAGATLFSGYVATDAERIYAGIATTGSVHRVAFSAVSDDVLAPVLGAGATHLFGDGDGTLHVAQLAESRVRELAQDVTVSGEIEPTAYITEYFVGDGTTDVFQLAQEPFRAASASLLEERFDQARINPQVWSTADAGSFLALTSAGLTMSGGNGFDGQTSLTAVTPIEIGGSLVIEADKVALGAGSDGVVCGLYSGTVARSNCFAGFNVRQSVGATIVTPFVNGAEVGTPLTMLSGHKYTLRLRLHCPEAARVNETYSAVVEGGLRSFGGGAVAAPVWLVFEARDAGVSSSTPATVLYAGSLASSPGSCSFAVVDSVQLYGSIGRCSITQASGAWIVSTATDGTQTVRVTGAAGDGVDCMVSPAGRITFFAGRIPVAGERITVMYRGRRRAVARLGDTAALPSTARWEGKVTHPPARSTADCESAALAVLSFAAGRGAAVSGTYATLNPEADILPGDVLAISSGGDTLKAIVRAVSIEDGHARPEVLHYRIDFANDWAAGLGLRLADTVAKDAMLPQFASATAANVLANLPALAVVSVTGSTLEIDAGTAPPAGGGFEVRRRDWAFGPGTDADLVMRSSVRSFSIPREEQVERYFVRMYDGSNPPVYSRFSSAVFTNLPVSS
jgi:hypothetical protein